MLYEKDTESNGELSQRASVLFLDVVRNFYTAMDIIEDKHSRVSKKQSGLEQALIEGQEVSVKKIRDMRDDLLVPMKEASHELFRSDGHRYPFDGHLSDIFHEVSKLSEDAYEILQIGQSGDAVEEGIVRSAKTEIKPLIQTIYRLFQKAEEELVGLLREQRTNRIIIRSLYSDAYQNHDFSSKPISNRTRSAKIRRLELLYDTMYDGGKAEGYLTVAESFADAGFYNQAREAYRKGIAGDYAHIPDLVGRVHAKIPRISNRKNR